MPEKKPPTESQRIEDALRRAAEPISIDEICEAVWGRIGDRERNLVRVNIHRLDERGRINKIAAKYSLRD